MRHYDPNTSHIIPSPLVLSALHRVHSQQDPHISPRIPGPTPTSHLLPVLPLGSHSVCCETLYHIPARIYLHVVLYLRLCPGECYLVFTPLLTYRRHLERYAVQSAQKRILSRTRKITPHVTNIPPLSHIPSPPIAHIAPHLSRKDPDFPWVKFLALFRTEPEVGRLFRRFSHYLEVVSRW